jgi:tetratricopeptide (TPR) repeat protein
VWAVVVFGGQLSKSSQVFAESQVQAQISDSPENETRDRSNGRVEDRSYLRQLIQEEVDRAMGRATLLMYVVAFLLVLLPTLSGIGIWLLLSKMERQSQLFATEIESQRDDALSQLRETISDAQSVVNAVQAERQNLDQKMAVLSSISQVQPELPSHGEEYEENEATESPETVLQTETTESPATETATNTSATPTPVPQSENNRAATDAAPSPTPAPQSENNQKAMEFFQKGNAAFLQGNYEEAIAAYDQAIEYKPDYYQAWSNRGSTLFQRRNYEEALQSYDRALELKSEYPEAWNNRGSVLVKMKQYQDALPSYKKALQLKPNYYEAWKNLGLVWQEMEQPKKAIQAYKKALKIKPDYVDAWYNLAQLLQHLKKHQAALDAYQKVSQFAPEHIDTWYQKARCHALQGNIDLACENLQQAINRNRDRYKPLAKHEPDFQRLQDSDRFQSLIE